MNSTNILIVGVGGQGTLLASKILGNIALKKGYDVKVSEVHGMSQRGGSVVTHIKLAEKVYSPLVEKGEADVIIAFEQLEAIRWMEYLKEEGTFIVNTQKINPMPVIMGKAKYPEGVIERLSGVFKKVISVNALEIAKSCGNIKAVNTVLLGVMAKIASFEKEAWEETLKEIVPKKFIDINLKAFREGFNNKFF